MSHNIIQLHCKNTNINDISIMSQFVTLGCSLPITSHYSSSEPRKVYTFPSLFSRAPTKYTTSHYSYWEPRRSKQLSITLLESHDNFPLLLLKALAKYTCVTSHYSSWKPQRSIPSVQLYEVTLHLLSLSHHIHSQFQTIHIFMSTQSY